MFLKPALGAALLLLAGSACAAPDPLARLGWLQGCWAAAGGAEAGSGEQWSAPAGGTMLGMGRTIRNGKTVEFEFFQIRETEAGKLAYLAQPQGRAPTTFTLLRASDTELVFENLAHDFPQRVIYRRTGGDTLQARIEGVIQDKPKGIDFPLRKTPCPN